MDAERFSKDLRSPAGRQRGATSVAVAGSLAATVALSAFVIDVGQLLSTRAELQTVADLASKSAAQELTRIYLSAGRGDPTSDQLTSSEMARIREAADRRGRRNTAGSVPIGIAPSDVQIGKWDSSTGAFVETNTGVNAVQVKARRDDLANSMVRLLLPGILGKAEMPLRSSSAARLSGISYVPAGVADFPVAISKAWYAMHQSPCETNNTITLYPTGTADACAGWHTFQEEPASAAALKSILNGLRTGTWTSPAIDIQDTKFIFSGGTVASAFEELERLYHAKKNAQGEMRVLIPVYDHDTCDNPNGWIRIIGVARAVVTRVVSDSNKLINARVECDVVQNVESGGPDFGVLAGGPELVR